MTHLTQDVWKDLLTIYLTGEASEGTRQLIEDRARTDAEFRRLLQLPEVPAPDPTERDLALVALQRTKQFLFLRSLFFGMGVFFTLLPLSFRFGQGGFHFFYWNDANQGLIMAFWSVALASWIARYVMVRQLRPSGL